MDEFDLRMLHYLKATKNITKTAQIMYLTQSALSRRIASLEKELDIQLLIRTKQGVRFTPEGEIIYQYSKNAESVLKSMRDKIIEYRGSVSGTLQLGVTSNFAVFQLTRLFVPFSKKYPYITTNIITDRSANIVRRLSDGELDVGIVRGEHDWSGRSLQLQTENVFLIQPPGTEHEELAKMPYIGRLTTQLSNQKISRWLHAHHIEVHEPHINVENIMTSVSMVEAGLGWTIVPEIALNQFQGIKRVLTDQNNKPLLHATSLIYQERTVKALPQAEAFVNSVMDYYHLPKEVISR
jgi:DNA-binding transcriptional LysR family regulator